MKRLLAAALLLTITSVPAQTDVTFTKVAEEVNPKVVKVFGAGGFKGLVSYATGVLISKDGLFLTVNSHVLDTRDLRIHTHDGTKYHCKVVCREPELDVALCKIDSKVEDLPFFDFAESY